MVSGQPGCQTMQAHAFLHQVLDAITQLVSYAEPCADECPCGGECMELSMGWLPRVHLPLIEVCQSRRKVQEPSHQIHKVPWHIRMHDHTRCCKLRALPCMRCTIHCLPPAASLPAVCIQGTRLGRHRGVRAVRLHICWHLRC
jgi:hypothetical protein